MALGPAPKPEPGDKVVVSLFCDVLEGVITDVTNYAIDTEVYDRMYNRLRHVRLALDEEGDRWARGHDTEAVNALRAVVALR